MVSDHSVSQWLPGVKEGDDQAVQEIWQRYYQRLVGLARRVLESSPRAAMDEEDVALSAVKSFCAGAAGGRFPRLNDRDDLWKLLMTITVRKAYKVRRKDGRAAAPLAPEVMQDVFADDQAGRGFTVTFSDELRRLLDLLGDDQLRQIVQLKLEGYTNKEIAQRFDRHETFAERKLRLIRRIWAEEITEPGQ